MITIDAPISFLLGAGLAYAGSKKNNPDYSAIFHKGFILQTCILTPVILFFMLRFPDWEWNYLFDAQAFFFGEDNKGLGAASIAAIAGLLNLTYIVGFTLARKLIEQGKQKRLLQLLLGTTALVIIIMLLMLEQTLHIGTLEEFNKGEAGLIFFNRDFLLAQSGAGVLLALGIFLSLKGSSKASTDA